MEERSAGVVGVIVHCYAVELGDLFRAGRREGIGLAVECGGGGGGERPPRLFWADDAASVMWLLRQAQNLGTAS